MDHMIFPRFWSEKPALWFAQVEAVFALSGITTDTDKYDYIITELDNDVIALLEDIILNPPGEDIDDKYAYLKREVIQRLSIAKLEKEELGKRKPSEFLQHLRNIADPRVPEQTVKRIWLTRLPKHITEIVTVESSGNIEVLSEMADKVLQVIPMPGAVAHCQSTEPVAVEDATTFISKLSVQLESLQDQLEKLQLAFNGLLGYQYRNCKQCDTNTNRSKNLNTTVGNNNTCWYHLNFGEKAMKCITPCTYKEKHASQDLLNATSF